MRVLVAGDVVRDCYLYGGQRQPGSSLMVGARCVTEPGGAALVGRLLRAIASRTAGAGEDATSRFVVDYGFPDDIRARDAFCIMRQFEARSGESGPIWRIAHALGYSDGDLAERAGAAAHVAGDLKSDVVVLDDAGFGFRRWPARHAWPRFLRQPGQNLPQWIVLKMSAPIAAGDLWHTIVSEHTQPEGSRESGPPQHLGRIASRTVLLLTVDDLRRECAQVNGWLSWERAAADLTSDLETHPRFHALKRVRFVVIRFSLDGAVIVERSGEVRRTLVFDPRGVEGTFLSGVPGAMFGYQSCLAAAIASRLVDLPSNADSQAVADRLTNGVKAGLGAMRHLVANGHQPTQDASFPYETVAERILTPPTTFASVIVPPGIEHHANWTIVAGTHPSAPSPLWGLARRIVSHGVGQLAGVPHLQFARLFSVDRSEIENLRTLQRLLTSYREDPRASKPLSVAAFGPPGSGKSFGVKQLAEALFGDRSPLEFNLAQFSTPGELHGLFHQVRDRVLQGHVPIVFWDEFDSRDLVWLQYLIGPMQDGTFQEGQITHPIGRCVFVFAGGTRYRFEEFGSPPAPLLDAGDEREAQRWREDFTAKKGPDFKSRLAGHLNVLGPNRRDDDDLTFPVRRALLLRVHLGLAPHARAVIDAGVVNAFLRVGTYRHGARSLEKIAEQVRRSSHDGAFNRSDLPPRQLLGLHVDADEFMKLVEVA